MVGPAVELADQMLMFEVLFASLVKLKIVNVVLKLALELEEDFTGGSLKFNEYTRSNMKKTIKCMKKLLFALVELAV